MHYVIESKEGYEIVINIERNDLGDIVDYKSIKYFPMKNFEDNCDNLGKLKVIDFIKKEEKLEYLDIMERLIKGKKVRK
jgi:hypothetical protein